MAALTDEPLRRLFGLRAHRSRADHPLRQPADSANGVLGGIHGATPRRWSCGIVFVLLVAARGCAGAEPANRAKSVPTWETLQRQNENCWRQKSALEESRAALSLRVFACGLPHAQRGLAKSCVSTTTGAALLGYPRHEYEGLNFSTSSPPTTITGTRSSSVRHKPTSAIAAVALRCADGSIIYVNAESTFQN